MKNRYVKNLLKIGIPVLLIGGLIAVKLMDSPVGESKKDIKKGTQIPVNAFIVKPFRLSSDIQAVGTLLPNEEVDLVAETTGKIVGIYFKEGQHVEKGALLLKVDDSDLQAQLKRALFQQKLLSEKLERQRILFEKDAVSREEFDKSPFFAVYGTMAAFDRMSASSRADAMEAPASAAISRSLAMSRT